MENINNLSVHLKDLTTDELIDTLAGESGWYYIGQAAGWVAGVTSDVYDITKDAVSDLYNGFFVTGEYSLW